MEMSVEAKRAYYHKHGYCPLATARHSKEVRDAIRAAGMRPMMKQCFKNSQRFIMRSDLADRLTYVEGVVGRATFHAWLLLDGKILDLTLDKEASDYRPQFTATCREVAEAFLAKLDSEDLYTRTYPYSRMMPESTDELMKS